MEAFFGKLLKAKLARSSDGHSGAFLIAVDLRHSKAVHLLRSGVPLIYIRDFLGHVSVTTTEIYAKVDTEEKRKALECAYEIPSQKLIPDWEADKGLMAWLTDLCRY